MIAGWIRIVGHVTPEAADGGPIALLQDGDRIAIEAESGGEHLGHDDQIGAGELVCFLGNLNIIDVLHRFTSAENA